MHLVNQLMYFKTNYYKKYITKIPTISKHRTSIKTEIVYI